LSLIYKGVFFWIDFELLKCAYYGMENYGRDEQTNTSTYFKYYIRPYKHVKAVYMSRCSRSTGRPARGRLSMSRRTPRGSQGDKDELQREAEEHNCTRNCVDHPFIPVVHQPPPYHGEQCQQRFARPGRKSDLSALR